MEKKMKRDLLLDFTHSYSMDWVGAHPELQYIDCSGIGGTDMYCTPEAEEELQKILEKYPLCGIHFFDSGNYHYMSRLFTKRMERPYQLVFFDNHTDMQPSMIPDLLSCGAWAKQVLEEDEYLQKLVLIGPPKDSIAEIPMSDFPKEKAEKLVIISREGLNEWGKLNKKNGLSKELPVYLSIDKDVLSEEYARTNWDQGEMNLTTLTEIIRWIGEQFEVLGVDICGELPGAASYEAAEVQRINESTNEKLYKLLNEVLE